VYVTAAVIKNARDVDRVSPARAFGIAPLLVGSDERQIDVQIQGPEVIRSNRDLTLNIATGNSGRTHLTVAAVDAGILTLTDFQTPDPFEFFYGKRQSYLNPYDIYSWIYPEIERAASHLSPPGGRMFAERRKRHVNPITARRVKPVALWSGIVETDAQGTATVEFKVGEFNGKLVVMAVAVQGDRVGAGTSEVIVRDPIVVQESFPRFVSPGDEVIGLATVFNNKETARPVTLSLETTGPVEMLTASSLTEQLAAGSETELAFAVKATRRPGKIECVLAATDGADSSRLSFELPNRPALPLTTLHGSGSVVAGDSITIELPSNWIEGTDEYVIQTSSLSAVEFARHINFLLRYPYGCLEQTTSRLFPLIYFDGLAKFADPELLKANAADYYINEGILKLTSLLRADGSFSFWPGGSQVHGWSAIYASHFMLEAKKAGFSVGADLERTIVDRLRDIALGRVNDTPVPERIYAAYALSIANRLERRVVNYLKQIHPDDIPVYSKFQLAGALARFGDTDDALAMLPEEIQPAIFEPETGGTFNSGVRTNAILLDVLTEIQPENPSTAVLAQSLVEGARFGRWYTTQATAFALMALGKYFAGQEPADIRGRVSIESDTSMAIDEKDKRLTRRGLAGKAVNIMNDGEGPIFYYWQASGVPEEGVAEEFERGIRVTRTYMEVDGSELIADSVRLGQQVICRIEASATNRRLSNVVIADLLPAGMEIENPRLKTSPRLSWLPGNKGRFDYQDIRDDRLLLFTNLSPGTTTTFHYSLRVIAAGTFKIPPITAECMYNPVIAGSSSSGVLKVSRDVME
jgi:uncharacterized protein YfaS (alpha-2-macroglobulin family)